MTETVLTNALIVLPDMLLSGSVLVRDGLIADVQEGRSALPGAIDLGGDLLIPGVVDVHTDNLERQVTPRSNARWPSRSAMLAHDAQCAAAGVTTVLDAICLGNLGYAGSRMQTSRDAVVDLEALSRTGLLKSEHFLHLRCEMPAGDVLAMAEPLARHELVRMASLMDHSPGVGQHRDLARYIASRRQEGYGPAEIERHVDEMMTRRVAMRAPNRAALLALFAGRGLALASHDDASAEEIAENAADGITIAEFPVTMVAAKAAHRAGMRVIAGAPNIVRGGSHTGNVAASDLLAAGVVDALASDYVPAALVEAAFMLDAVPLPQAIGMITAIPADLARLPDRGRIAPGLRADLVHLTMLGRLPVIRAVWREGARVA